jgi:hypothetical protein
MNEKIVISLPLLSFVVTGVLTVLIILVAMYTAATNILGK